MSKHKGAARRGKSRQAAPRRRHKAPVPVLTTRERDLLELRAERQRVDRQVADAFITVLCRADPRALAALGVVVAFIVQRATRRSR